MKNKAEKQVLCCKNGLTKCKIHLKSNSREEKKATREKKPHFDQSVGESMDYSHLHGQAVMPTGLVLPTVCMLGVSGLHLHYSFIYKDSKRSFYLCTRGPQSQNLQTLTKLTKQSIIAEIGGINHTIEDINPIK